MLDRAAPLPALLTACLLLSPLACKDAHSDGALAAERERSAEELAALRADLEAVTAERDEIAAKLETELGCRKQVIGSLTAYGAPGGPHADATARVVAEAKAYLEQRVAARERGEKLAIVLDVDETALDNFEQLTGSDFCFVRENWNQWVSEGTPGVVPGIEELYDYARANEVAVVFITGRREHQREDTKRVLEEAGFEGWEALILRSETENELSAAEYKSARRAKLEDEGFTIVLTLGDQASDLVGGHAERTLLVPNPFYHVD
ncbi:Lipoprotein E precursor [Enhygromyxa salina]|uniref:Lipoprotein E n=1 Tax=Enhygromyxa salina TaxID=215803 RepID=A0A2S9XAP5_9BACT|nr:HAD family acid phosphatase [Enhygromyxa salina]PRP89923.1 Lipoprotein E precursor [Enhygromyxa salina]